MLRRNKAEAILRRTNSLCVCVSRNKGDAMEDKESSCEEEYEYYTDTENEADGEDNGKLNI